MSTQGERIAALEVHRENHATDLVEIRADLLTVREKVSEIHDGLKWFIRGAKFTAALGIVLLALKGGASWSDVRDAFRAI